MSTIIHPQEPSTENIELTHALLFHKIDASGHHHNRTTIITRHHVVHDDNGVPMLGAGNELNPADQLEIIESIAANAASHTHFLEPHILSVKASGMAWYVRGRVAPMYFKIGGKNITLKAVPWPNLIYKASKQGLSVVAVKTNRRPTANSLVYHAPLMNIYSHTKLCSGNITLPTAIRPGFEQEWQDTIEKTLFTHTNHNNTLKPDNSKTEHDAVHLKFWKALNRGKVTTFPNTALCRKGLQMTVKEWIENE